MRHTLIPTIAALSISFMSAGLHAEEQQASPAVKKYVCPPCDHECHDKTFDEPGRCDVCRMRLIPLEPVRNVAVVIFDGVDPLDFTGPAGVLASARAFGRNAFRVYTVAAGAEPVRSGFLTITPNHAIADCPTPEILIIPGGVVDSTLEDAAIIDWVQEHGLNAEIVMSIGSGALVLAKCGMLDDVEATTSHDAVDALRTASPKTDVQPTRRIIDNGDLMTAAGASAGIDAGLHIVKRVIGDDVARKGAADIEYDWLPELSRGLIDYLRETGINDRTRPHVDRLITDIEKRLAAGRFKSADVIADPAWFFIHEQRAFRDAIRRYATGSSAVLVTPEEPGDRIVVTGTVKDADGKPVPDALIYVYHTDVNGTYSSGGGNTASMGDSLNPRLFAYLKTAKDGSYEYRTIRPSGYPGDGPPAHVHYEVRAEGYAELSTELMFDDDPRISDENRESLVANGIVVAKVEKRKDELGACVCDLTLMLE